MKHRIGLCMMKSNFRLNNVNTIVRTSKYNTKKNEGDHHRSVCLLTVEVEKKRKRNVNYTTKKNQLSKDVLNTNIRGEEKKKVFFFLFFLTGR